MSAELWAGALAVVAFLVTAHGALRGPRLPGPCIGRRCE